MLNSGRDPAETWIGVERAGAALSVLAAGWREWGQAEWARFVCGGALRWSAQAGAAVHPNPITAATSRYRPVMAVLLGWSLAQIRKLCII